MRHVHLLLLAVFACVHPISAADAPDLVAMSTRVLTEAEQLGLPSLAGCTLYEGMLTRQELDRWQRLGLRSERHLQARRPDGSWLVDLIHPVATEQLDQAEIAALRPFVPGSVFVPSAGERMAPYPDTLAQARRIAAGVPEAAANFPPRPYRSWSLSFYPRQDRPGDPEEALRLACRDQLLAQGAVEQAQRIVPERWRAATRRRLIKLTPPDPLPAGVIGQVAGFRFPGQWKEPGVDVPLLPEVADDALVALAGEHGATVEGCTVGETALYLLGARWGLDPALLAGRDPQDPWDDAEQAAVAAALTAWFGRTAGRPLAERWFAALVGQPVERVLDALDRRAQGMSGRRHTARDRLNGRTWSGPTPPVVPPDDAQELVDGYLDRLLTGWEAAGTPPAGLSIVGMRRLLPYVDDGRSFNGDTDPAVMRAAMERAGALSRHFTTTIASWPRSGALAEALLLWDDRMGSPAGLDAMVDSALATPGLTATQAQMALRWWVHRCSPARWSRLAAILQRDPGDAQWQGLAAIALRPFTVDVPPIQLVDTTRLVGWQLLQDVRPLPPTGAGALAAPSDATVGSAVAAVLAGPVLHMGYPPLPDGGAAALRRLEQPGAGQVEREAARVVLSQAFAREAAELLTRFQVALPAGLVSPVRTVVTPAAPAPAPGLTSEETTAIRGALTEARTLGFPELSGAQVLLEDFPGDTVWWGAHLRLADGSWLAEGNIPVAQADPGAQPSWAVPVDGRGLMISGQLPEAARVRLQAGIGLGAVASRAEDAVLPALAWWLSGSDPDGRCVIAAVYREAVTRHDLAEIWSIAASRGGDERGRLSIVPSIPDGVRRSLARWFRHRLVWAADAAEADRAAAAVRQLLPAADRPAWEPLLAALRARIELPITVPAGADLAVRLQSWRDTLKTAKGQWRHNTGVPATRADTPALVALLTDDRPTRWVGGHALPRPLGDAALEALGELWGVDWRWLVVDDPAVAAVLPPRRETGGSIAEDEWLWSETAWTAERRRVIVGAIQAWWQAHGAEGAPPPITVFRTLPIRQWDESLSRLSRADAEDPRLGDTLAGRLQAMTLPDPQAPMQQYTLAGILAAAVSQPRHPRITEALASWPQGAWVVGITALRAEFAGDTAVFDRWMQQAFDHGRPPVDGESGDLAASPWGAIGLWVHHPSPARLRSLRQVQAHPPEDAAMRWLLIDTGSRDWLQSSLGMRGDRSPADGEMAQAIPCALALGGLADLRPLAPVVLQGLQLWARQRWEAVSAVAQALPADARVCDWVAARMLLRGSVLGTVPSGLGTPKGYLASPLAQREVIRTALAQLLAPLAEETALAAGLAPAAALPATPSGF